ncbi:hypothetical protein [Clostridium culturomicium]|uniref:hypothetical protein n=1 Tax=Clostridium culturomicium TaxID=1499683 RepID=UPI00058E8581|nr:hypothetical protein [Clostridium culturomicium]
MESKDLKNGVKIANIEGKWINRTGDKNIYEAKYKTKTGKVVEIGFNKIFTATMPYSLETLRAFDKYKDRFYSDENGIWTNLFLNLKFSKGDKVEINGKVKKINKKDIRKDIYINDFTYNNVEYTFFKRGGSKARTANVIMVDKKCYEELFKPCLLGLELEKDEPIDLTSLEAYISLIMSSIIGTIDINKDEILIIDDVESEEFKAYQTITTLEGQGNADYFKVINNLTDGQGLLDESIFIENELLKTSTCALLRNDFLKCNALRTRLQKYYSENGITKVWDMYRGWIDASKIKLVITPSSCKYLKFDSKFNSEKECYLNWLNNIPEIFGVVKTDHKGNYGYSNRLSYQMINSMNINKEEMNELMKDEIRYLKLLINNSEVDSVELRKMNKKNKADERVKRNKMSYYINSIGKSDELSTDDMITALLKRNTDYRFTDAFKIHKKHQIESYLYNLRLGKIRIKNSLYAIMIANPYTMLKATIREGNKIISKEDVVETGAECYCPRFGNTVELLSIRNPQINGGNVYHMTNRYHDEYKWFGYVENDVHKHDFVVFVNAWDVDIMNRLQGCDWDIDTTFLTDNNLLVEKARENEAYATPVNGISGSKMIKRYNKKELAKLDNYLGQSTMNIGKIVNKSAIFNAYMYDAINTGKSEEYIQACYDASSALSSYSQIAIDMAKKSFVDKEGKPLSLIKLMNELNRMEVDGEEILQYKKGKNDKNEDVKYMVVPEFFKYIASDNSYRTTVKMECGMDYLEEILDNFKIKAMKTDSIKVEELLNDPSGRRNNKKMDHARKIISECSSSLNSESVIYDKDDTKEKQKEKYNLRKYYKSKAVRELKELNLNSKTIYTILARAFDIAEDKDSEIYLLDKDGEVVTYTDKDNNIIPVRIKEFKEVTSLCMTLLFNAYKDEFIKCFKENNYKNELTKDVKNVWR